MTESDYAERIAFNPPNGIVDVNLSDLTLSTPQQVDSFYDAIGVKIADTGRSWYFLINYENCTIEPGAWFQYAFRGKQLNIACSLGCVRYAAPKTAEDAIRDSAEKEDFDPNLAATREQALARIEAMKAG